MSEYVFKKNAIKSNKFLYLSNYTREKGILDLLHAFNNMATNEKKITLECYGEFLDDNIKQAVLKFQSNRLTINRIIIDEKKFKTISNCDCLVFPSWNEGQPLVILEAMSQGLIMIKMPLIK